MDKWQKAQKMAEINLMLKIKAKRIDQKQSLEQMAMKLMQDGIDKDQIAHVLAVRENLTPEAEQAVLAFISKQ